MDPNIDGVIADLQVKLKQQEDEVAKTKQLINLLCNQYGRNPIYPDAESNQLSCIKTFAADEFYGQPLAGSIRKILEYRKVTGLGPATPRDVYEALLQGGYSFDTNDEQNRLTGIRISLRKGSSIFHRLPDGKRYGLLEWYPKAKRRQNKGGNQQLDSEDDNLDVTSDSAYEEKKGD